MIKLMFLTLLLSTTTSFAEMTGPELEKVSWATEGTQYLPYDEDSKPGGEMIKTAVTNPNLLPCSKLLIAIYKPDAFIRGGRRFQGHDAENQRALTRIYNAKCL